MRGAKKETIMVALQVNGQQCTYDGDPSVPLLWVLRDEISDDGLVAHLGDGRDAGADASRPVARP
jgi:aerobic-type carbon monoxide dehydrogenase small subunit (CoxS/CutS family)